MQPAALPEPEALFDSLLARKEFKEHPNKISSVLFYLASIIIHGEFAFQVYLGRGLPGGILTSCRPVPDRSKRSNKVVDFLIPRSVSPVWKQSEGTGLSENIQGRNVEARLLFYQAGFRFPSRRWCPSYHV